MITLEPCPHCGTPLTPALVRAIRDPLAEESCPRHPKGQKAVAATIAPKITAGFDALNATIERAADALLAFLAASEPRESAGSK